MRTTSGRSWVLAIIAFVLATAGLVMPTPAHADESTKILLLLDVSGSMNERISSGGTKFAAAKRALKQVSSALPAGTQVGLRVYGSKIAEPKSENPKACTDSELVLPIGPLDQSKMNRAVDSFTAKGETPIAYSLGKAVDDLGSSGKRVVVLISDGEETCAKDPCPTARKLAGSGVDLQFNAIGLAVGSKARKQLTCIADAGNGTYYDASETDGLNKALRKITQRALRPFQVSGTPVSGADSPAAGPELPVGQYVDRYDKSEAERYYTIPRTPGSRVTASIASITDPKNAQSGVGWRLTLATEDGQKCAENSLYQGSMRAVSVISGAISTAPPEAGSDDVCQTAPRLVFGMTRLAGKAEVTRAPVEIVVSEEPPIVNLDQLPDPVGNYTGRAKRVTPSKKAEPVTGGSAFSNAPAVEPGSYADAVAIGETVFYRIRVEPGQTLRATVEAPWPAAGRSSLDGSAAVAIQTLTPARSVTTEQFTVLTNDGKVRVSAAAPQVRVRNREADTTSPITYASVGGDYYVALQVSATILALRGRVIPVRVSFAVAGTPAGQPQYDQSAPSATPTPTSTEPSPATSSGPPPPTSEASAPPEADGGRNWLLPVGVVALAGAIVTAAALLLSRRRRSAG